MGARIVKLALASACTFMMAGCVAGNSHVGGATGLAAFPRAQILGDAAKELGKLFPPALTKVEVLGDRRDPLREDFLALLRRRGFAVVDRPEKGAPPVKGTLPVKIDLTNLDENTVFTRIQMGNQSAARAYTVDPYVKAVAAWTVNLTGAREEVEERAFRAPDYTEAPPSAGAPKAAEPVQAPLPVAAAPVPEQASTPSLGHWTLYMGTLHTRDQVSGTGTIWFRSGQL